MNHEPLKPCPFCGGKAFMVMGCNGKEVFYIRCDECEATGEKFDNNDPHGQAILAWNNRELMHKYKFFINEIKSHINTGHTEIAAGWLLDQIKRIEGSK